MILEARNVSKAYPSPEGAPLTVLQNINFQLAAGQRASLMGPSGAGKTTLISLLAGLDQPSSGEILLDGRNLAQLSSSELVRFRASRIGIVFQQFHLMPFLNAIENVRLPLDLRHEKDSLSLARQALESVGLSHRMGHLPHQLSRGECQRVAIARVLAVRPSLVLADEPTGSLDQNNAREVMRLLLNLIEFLPGSSLLLVTHDPQLAHECEAQYNILDTGLVRVTS